MNPIVFHAILFVMGSILVCALGAPIAFLISQMTGSKKALIIAKMIGGVAYLLLGTLGLVVIHLLPQAHHWIYLPMCLIFDVLGIAMLRSGNKLRGKDPHSPNS